MRLAIRSACTRGRRRSVAGAGETAAEEDVAAIIADTEAKRAISVQTLESAELIVHRVGIKSKQREGCK